MTTYYSNLVKKLGEAEAKAHMREVAAKRTVFKGGAFRNPKFAKQAQLRSAEVRKQNNAKQKASTEQDQADGQDTTQSQD